MMRSSSRALRLWGMLLFSAWLVGSAGCRSTPPPRPPEDRKLTQLNQAARDAFDEGSYDAAARLYAHVLERAQIRNDFLATTDAHYNLAVSLLKEEDFQDAARHLQAARVEYARMTLEPPPEFDLLEATLLYRQGHADEAWTITERILTEGRSPPAVLRRTYYLRGRLADGRGDPEALREAIFALNRSESAEGAADLEDLKGRLALSEGRWEEAAAAFDRAATLERREMNYVSMAETLALSAQASEKGQRPREAAIRYLHAGRSAALREDTRRARLWLGRAADLAEATEDQAILEEVEDLLKLLGPAS